MSKQRKILLILALIGVSLCICLVFVNISTEAGFEGIKRPFYDEEPIGAMPYSRNHRAQDFPYEGMNP